MPLLHLVQTLERFFSVAVPFARGDRAVVAFSGGPDSTALLAGMAELARRRGASVDAVHLDHGLDQGSADRADAARGLAATIGVPFFGERREVGTLRRAGESVEEAARRVRYDFLEARRQAREALYVATAHHRDDQAETLLLRLLFGTGLHGLGAIAARRGPLVRPVLELRSVDLERATEALGLEPVDDPTNRDLAHARNLVRSGVLPRLRDRSPGLTTELARLASTAERARRSLFSRLDEELSPDIDGPAVRVNRRAFERLAEELRPAALACLHRTAGAAYPPTRQAIGELARQLADGKRVGCDCGGGWRLESAGEDLRLCRASDVKAPEAPSFAYTLTLPGEVSIPELGGRFRLRRAPVESWMFTSRRWKAGLSLPLSPGDRVTVRSRRPGDKIRPFGCSYRRRLKDVLMDRKVPRQERGRLPLLCMGSRILWAPGVSIDETCRIGTSPSGSGAGNSGERDSVWVAEFRHT